MTEEDAKTKWCPFVRHQSLEEYGASNRAGKFNDDGVGYDSDNIWNKCVGSACMAWRTEHFIDEKRMPDVRGYCGLAGKP